MPELPVEAGAGDKPFLILVSSYGRSSREYFLASVGSRYRMWLFLGGPGRLSEPTWELAYTIGHTSLDTLDATAMTAEAKRLDNQLRSEHGEGIAGIISYDEARVVATAAVAEALGLPTSPVEAIERCRDKHRTRQALDAANVPQAKSVAVRSPEQATSVADRLGYPVVVKPRHLAVSLGVTRADSAEELTAAYSRAVSITLPETPGDYDDPVLVEEYLDGPEISVDSACFDGRIVPLAVAHKEVGFPPSFEEVGHVVDGADPLLHDEHLHDVLARAHQAVGFSTGMTHTELRRTETGFKVIEINARLGGDLIPYLGQLATGVDLSLAAAAIACGQTPDLTPGSSQVAAVRFYYPDQDLTVAEVRIEDDRLPASILQADVLAAPGQHLTLPQRRTGVAGRLAQAVAVGGSEEDCQAALDAVADAITVVAAAQ
ncbi:ATP-grasp domain-containing protein [Jatrophihabitans sp.]|uniref:ATP-grasp domain-containing protein n=1 Tax=Jatrophihabitans sp. TaxID=1932789 RepID=UPI002BDD881E|nr:ATP-grasp domain-containing protein [Jatrophihabitans sp.]